MRKVNLINCSKMERKTAYRTFLNDLHTITSTQENEVVFVPKALS